MPHSTVFSWSFRFNIDQYYFYNFFIVPIFFSRHTSSLLVSYKYFVGSPCIVVASFQFSFFRSASNRSCRASHYLWFPVFSSLPQDTTSTWTAKRAMPGWAWRPKEEREPSCGECWAGLGLPFLRQVIFLAFIGVLFLCTWGLIVKEFVILPMNPCRLMSVMVYVLYYAWRTRTECSVLPM